MPWAEAFIRNQIPEQPENSNERILTYTEALHEALDLAMEFDPKVFILGQGIDTPPNGMFGISKGLWEKYGHQRCFDTPLSEAAMTGICTGAAMAGLRPIYFHNRPDFLFLAMDQLINHAAKMHYMDAGKTSVPLVIWAAISRGWGSGPQHSQSIHGMLMGIPGLKIIVPSTPADAKGLMLSAIADNNPVLFFDHRFIMRQKGPVPMGMYRIPLGKGVYRQKGRDLTIAGVSHTLQLAIQALHELQEEEGITADIIDFRTLKPLDTDILFESVEKTGRLLVVDTGWEIGGFNAEVGFQVAEHCFNFLKAPIRRIGFPDIPTPAGFALEQLYYPDVKKIKLKIKEVLT